MNVDQPKFYRLFELLLRMSWSACRRAAGSRYRGRDLANGAATSRRCKSRCSDNGPGLPKEALRLVFDPFVVRSDSPLEYGINLMACYFIVHHHGGRIEARSEEGQGTTFTLQLPVNPSLVPAATATDTEFLQKAVLNQALWDNLWSPSRSAPSCADSCHGSGGSGTR